MVGKISRTTLCDEFESNQQLAWLLFDQLKERPTSLTDKGDPKVDAAFLKTLKDKYKFIAIYCN